MKKTILIIASLFLFIMCKQNSKRDKQFKSEEKTTSLQNKKEVEIVFSSQDVRPGNLAITKDGRLFTTMNPLVAPKTKVFELNKNGKNTFVQYPNEKYATGDASIFKAVIGIRADSKNNLWVLDLAAKQFVVWNTNTEALVKTIKIPDNVLTPTSFLQDFIIDELHNRVIIADMTQGDLKSKPTPAFVVINTENGNAKRMAESHLSMMPEMEGGFALNPIAIDPNFEYVYFGALHGRTIYRVPATSFDNEETLKKDIKKFGTKSYSDGIAVDANENVYITNIEKSEIGVYNKQDGFKTLATLPKGQSWPDGLYIGNDDYLYLTVDQLDRTAALNKGNDTSTGPFLIAKTKLVPHKKTQKVGFSVIIKAKKGKEEQLSEFLKSAIALAEKEPNTLQWFAYKIDNSTYGVFDTFESESGRLEHLHGKIAEALFSKEAKEIIEGAPLINKTNILGYK